jgi:hypothetical protein
MCDRYGHIRGKREEGRGKREEGRGKRECETQDEPRNTQGARRKWYFLLS